MTKNFLRNIKFDVRKGVVVALMLAMLVVGVGYSQFARQTTDTGSLGYGWGYGYGYGYGLGHGWDQGQYAGHRIGGGNLDTYGYGYGRGYMIGSWDEGEAKYIIAPEDLPNLAQAGLIVPNDTSIEETTSVTFVRPVIIAFGSIAYVDIAKGTELSVDSSTNFADIAAGLVASPTGLSAGLTSLGGVQFGFDEDEIGMTSSKPITISVNVGSQYNGQTVNVYHKSPGSEVFDVFKTCTITSNYCVFTAENFSEFVAAKSASSGGTIHIPGTGTGTGPGAGTETTPDTDTTVEDTTPKTTTEYKEAEAGAKSTVESLTSQKDRLTILKENVAKILLIIDGHTNEAALRELLEGLLEEIAELEGGVQEALEEAEEELQEAERKRVLSEQKDKMDTYKERINEVLAAIADDEEKDAVRDALMELLDEIDNIKERIDTEL